MRRKRLAGLALLIAMATALPAAAHSLIHMHCRILFNFDGAAVNAFGQTWTFDAHYSGHLIEDFDKDGDGAFSPAEVSAMEETVLPTLARSRYFTFVSVDGRDVGAIAPYTFNAKAENGIVTFAMSMALPTPVDPRHGYHPRRNQGSRLLGRSRLRRFPPRGPPRSARSVLCRQRCRRQSAGHRSGIARLPRRLKPTAIGTGPADRVASAKGEM